MREEIAEERARNKQEMEEKTKLLKKNINKK